jgi:HK97 family phage major capsid protein
VSTGAIEWVIIGPDPEAAVVAEGAPKPEATLTFTPASAALETLAHWIQITRQALEDASYIQSLIETKLRRGLALKAEHDAAAAIVAGWPAVGAVTGTTLLEAIRVGIATVEDRGYRPNAVLMNPADWAALDIAVMVESVDGPARQQTFWGLRPVASSDVAAGTAYVGDFQSAVTLFDRGVSNVFLTDSHAANFISNVLVILAETRLKTVATELLAAVPVQAAP